MEQTNAAGMHAVLTRKALTPVAAIPVSMVMGCHVVIMMSVHGVSTIVIRKLCALTHRDHIAALVQKDITEMVDSVKVRELRRSIRYTVISYTAEVN